eukprot:624704-Lingulodinium_polyedra.AAC.1
MEPSGFFWPIFFAKEHHSGRIGGLKAAGVRRCLGLPAVGTPSVLAVLGARWPSSWSFAGLATPAAGAAAVAVATAVCTTD